MLSGVRISQARVKQVPCEDLPSFADASQFVCNGHNSDWDTDDEEKGAFGAGPRKFEWAGWPELNSSRSACEVCSPSVGEGERIAPGVADNRIGTPTSL